MFRSVSAIVTSIKKMVQMWWVLFGDFGGVQNLINFWIKSEFFQRIIWSIYKYNDGFPTKFGPIFTMKLFQACVIVRKVVIMKNYVWMSWTEINFFRLNEKFMFFFKAKAFNTDWRKEAWFARMWLNLKDISICELFSDETVTKLSIW